jgi:uncharacterized membrane protein (UPF0136 family)
MASYIVLIYGILVIIGGVMGYVKAKSRASITMGSISGILLVVCGVLMMRGMAFGVYAALVISIFLGVILSFRFKGSRKFMPGGLMVVLSLIAVVFLLLSLYS